jgi:hypothetical protein
MVGAWLRSLSKSDRPSAPQTTASPSIIAERTLSRIAASTTRGKRWLQL